MIDIIHNPAIRSLTKDTYYKYYLGIIEVASRYFVPIGITDKTPRTVLTALKKWARLHGPTAGYTMSEIEQIHGDFDAACRSQEFVTLTSEEGVRITYAAPRHQEQNRVCESSWRNVRNLAFAYMNDAQVDMSFFPFALQHAWKAYATLPHSALTTETGESQSPHLVYFNRPASIVNFKVLFCRVIMNHDNIFVINPLHDVKQRKKPRLDALNRKSNSQRGNRGIHVGLSQDSKTFMVYSPSTGRIYHTRDCVFDEQFTSTLPYSESKFSGYLKVQVTDAEPDHDLPFERAGIYPSQPDECSTDGMIFYEQDDNGLLEDIHDYQVTTNPTDVNTKVELQVRYFGEDNPAWVDYNEFYKIHPEAVISFFHRLDLIDMFPDGIIGTELNDPVPRNITLSPLPEEETNNQHKPKSKPNNIAGGDYSCIDGGE
jgi:hypothetical protein